MSRQKIGEKTMDMAKNSCKDSGQKLHGMEKKRKKKRKRKIMTISKDNKWMILLLLKLTDSKLFP